jgi:hypothetical protein
VIYLGKIRRAIIRIERGRRIFFRSVDNFNETNKTPLSFDHRKKRTIFDEDEDEEDEL